MASQVASGQPHRSGTSIAAALQQIDGVLAEYQNGTACEPGTPKQSYIVNQSHVTSLVLELRNLLVNTDQRVRLFKNLPQEVQDFIKRWVVTAVEPKSYSHLSDVGNMEDKMRRLESDKESLVLQVSVLSDQVEAQSEKIRELEGCIYDKGSRLETTVSRLHNEEISRRALETHKLDLLAEISSLKLKLATAEKNRQETEERLLSAQRQIDHLQSRLNDRTIEVTELKTKLKNGTIPGTYDSAGHLEGYNLYPGSALRSTFHGTFPGSSSRIDAEVEKLKKAVEALVEANGEKDKSLEEMRKVLRRYKKLEDYILSTQGRNALDVLNLSEDDHSGGSSSFTSASSPGDPSRTRHGPHGDMPSPSATSTPVNFISYHDDPSQTLTPPSTISSRSPHNSPRGRHPGSIDDALANYYPPRTPPSTVRRRVEAITTLPKDHRPMSPANQIQSLPRKQKGFASFGKGFFKLGTGKWSSSAPNLAETEQEEDALRDEMARQYKNMQSHTYKEPKEKKKAKGFRKFFGRLRRSNSQDFDGDRLEDFKRSGLRATAGARLGWSRDVKQQDFDMPFSRWDADRIATWLHVMGLSMYVGNCKAWVKNGAQLINATSSDLEKELGVRNHYHRKKLQLALQAIGSAAKDHFAHLDHHWVTRWLDDIGLPQYKDQFSEARVDGRMLHHLTVEDLLGLKVTNALHHVSIKRGIQVLRMNGFNSACLQRRPAPDEKASDTCPEETMLWTNHRVMEWLRTIDLSEYASNLRGSGVHGALMVLEPRFSAELFASLLSIPNSKTLLRRHLSTHFVGLIGIDIQHKKREFEQSTDYTPLTPSAKVKMSKRGLFKHKRTKSEQDWDEYVCPMNIQSPLGREGWRGEPPSSRNGTLPRVNQGGLGMRQRGVLSKEIHVLTDMLSKDNFLDDVPTSNV